MNPQLENGYTSLANEILTKELGKIAGHIAFNILSNKMRAL